MEQSQKLKILFVLPPKYKDPNVDEQGCYVGGLIEVVQPQLDKYAIDPANIPLVTTLEEYHAIPEAERYAFDVLLIQMGPFAPTVCEDQAINSKCLKFVHTLSAGIDGFVAKKAFRESPIPLTNAKGAYSEVLGEFVALGVLYHTKHVERFIQRKKDKNWEMEPMELVSKKHMAVVGYGSIGAACARIAKMGFQMKVSGVKRNPDSVPEDERAYCDEIVGNDQYERVISEADFVVGVLPGVPGLTDDFFNMESTFSKMKKNAVFMNIGRGTCVNEEDLVKALKTKMIGGAVLDVFKKEPLDKSSELWDCENVLITPHCADRDSDFLKRSIVNFGINLDKYAEGGL